MTGFWSVTAESCAPGGCGGADRSLTEYVLVVVGVLVLTIASFCALCYVVDGS